MIERFRGLALVAVLWILAALASASAVMTQQLRAEAQRRIAQAEEVRAVALAQGALIQVLARGALQTPWPDPPTLAWRVETPEGTVMVRLRSSATAVDLNHAPRDLLAAVFRYLGDLNESQARDWADAVVAQRRQHEAQRAEVGPSAAFQSVQDLLAKPGLPMGLWLRVQSALTVDSGAAGVDPWSADEPVLLVLAQGDTRRLQAWLTDRAQGRKPDWTTIPADWKAGSPSGGYVLEGSVSLAEGGALTLRWVLLSTVATEGGLPWKIVRQSIKRDPT